MTDVVQFTTEDLKKRITETTQAQFGMLIPQEMFEKLVQESITNFTDKEQTFHIQEIDDPDYTGNHWNRPKVKVLAERMTPFQCMVRNALQPLVKEQILSYIESYREEIKKQIQDKMEIPQFTGPLTKNIQSLLSASQELYLLNYMDMIGNNMMHQIEHFNSRLNQIRP